MKQKFKEYICKRAIFRNIIGLQFAILQKNELTRHFSRLFLELYTNFFNHNTIRLLFCREIETCTITFTFQKGELNISLGKLASLIKVHLIVCMFSNRWHQPGSCIGNFIFWKISAYIFLRYQHMKQHF